MSDRFTVWIDAYEKAWRTAGTGALTRLFTEDAVYRPGPFEPTIAGLEAVAEFWEAERDGPDEVFTLSSELVAAQRDTGVARMRSSTAVRRSGPTAICGSSRSRATAAAARSRSGRFTPGSH